MRIFLPAAALAFVMLGCAHEEDLRPAREPSTESSFSSTFSSAPPPQSYEAPPNARPRLSQTVTLGQDDYSPQAPPPAAGPSNGTNVTVNNNIVVNQPPAYYGGYGYGGYGYGGYSSGRNVGHNSSPAWRGSGWEGAQRTAAPGQTPAVGGNWSPPPSSGPAQMK